jgi:hypothetical protein
MKQKIKHYLFQLLISVDQTINVVLGGYADETLSSRAYRSWHKRKLFGRVLKPLIDGIFRLFGDKYHCYKAWQAEVHRKQVPRDLSL